MMTGDWIFVGIAIVAMAAAILATEGWMRKLVMLSAFLLAEIAFGSDMTTYAQHVIRDDGAFLGLIIVAIVLVFAFWKRSKAFEFGGK